MVVLKNQNRRSGIFYLRPLCGFGFFSKSDFSAIFFSHFRSSTDSFLKFSLSRLQINAKYACSVSLSWLTISPAVSSISFSGLSSGTLKKSSLCVSRRAKANPKITALQVELAHVDSEIEKLVDSLTGANNVLFSYVNVKIAELDGRKQELLARIAELTVEAISPEQVSQISGYLDTWENVSFDDKRRVVDLMITTIAATSDSLNITWKI